MTEDNQEKTYDELLQEAVDANMGKISNKREQFCHQLAVRGWDPMKIHVKEKFYLVEDELKYCPYVIDRETGETISPEKLEQGPQDNDKTTKH